MTEMVKAVVNGQFEIVLPKHRADRPDWYMEEGWERARLDSIHSHLGEGDVMYYVGAEEGEMAALCQMWGAKVVVFEPNPKVWGHFKPLWSANNLDTPLASVTCFASDKTDNPKVYIGEWPPEADMTITAAHGFAELQYEAAKYGQVKIDDLVYKYEIAPPTAISIDVEGSEWRVLGGAEEVLKQYKPKIWLSGHPEFMILYWNEYLSDLRNWLKDRGYKETFLDYKHEVHLFYE